MTRQDQTEAKLRGKKHIIQNQRLIQILYICVTVGTIGLIPACILAVQHGFLLLYTIFGVIALPIYTVILATVKRSNRKSLEKELK